MWFQSGTHHQQDPVTGQVTPVTLSVVKRKRICAISVNYVISVGDEHYQFCPDCCLLVPPFLMEENAHFLWKYGK